MYVKVKVFPGAKKELIIEKEPNSYELHVREEAKRNQANRRVEALLAERFEVPVRAVHMLSGHRSPQKLFSIDEDL